MSADLASMRAAPAPGTVPYSRVQQIFDTRCAGGACHTDAIDPAFVGASLDLSAAQAAPCLVNYPSAQDKTRLRVKPGDPDASYLIHKVDRTYRSIYGTWMPIADPLSADDVAVLRAWVRQGAQGGAAGACTSGPDLLPPAFAGAASAKSAPSSVTISGSPATDDRSAQDKIVYLGYQAGAPGGQDFAQPSFTPAPNSKCSEGGIEGVKVELLDEKDRVLLTLFTNRAGNFFTAEPIDAPRYRVRLSKDGKT